MTAASPTDRATEAQVAAAITRCASGDRAALRVIYDIEAQRMVGVARRMLRRQDLAEEAVQDTFMRMWRAARSFDPAKGSARTWLYAILRNCAISILRDEGRFEPDRRAVVVLAYVHGLSHGELAGKLGVPLGTVKSWARRSLISLQECMG